MNETKLMLKKKKTSGGDDVFFAATGVSDGDLLRGVRFEGGGRGRTQSMVMRAASGTVRTIETEHRWGQARAGKREVRRKSPGKVFNFSSKQKNIKRAKKTHSLFLLSLPSLFLSLLFLTGGHGTDRDGRRGRRRRPDEEGAAAAAAQQSWSALSKRNPFLLSVSSLQVFRQTRFHPPPPHSSAAELLLPPSVFFI